MKEEQLIDDLRRQKTSAQQQLLVRYGPAVFRTVQRIVVRQEEAEEVYQDVFLKAIRSIGTYDREKASLGTWLSRIAYHEALNYVRRKMPVMVTIEDREWEVEREGEDDSQVREASIDQLERGLEMLPVADRALLTMYYYDGMSLSEIAYVEGSNPSTLGSRLCRIRKKLYRITQTT